MGKQAVTEATARAEGSGAERKRKRSAPALRTGDLSPSAQRILEGMLEAVGVDRL